MAKKRKTLVSEFPQITKEEIQQIPIGKIVMDAFLDFGNYINNQRHTASIYDGCKPSYRRLIYAGLQFPKGKIVPSTNFISSVSNYHPHSLSGIEGLNSVLVHTGVFSGEGSWGYTEINGTYNQYAAPRYTKERVSDLYLDILGDLWKEVPVIESPVGPMEIAYLPLPIPLCLRGDTKIYLIDGRNITIEEVVNEFNQGIENSILSCSTDGIFSAAKIINGCKTKTTKRYVKVTLSNGEIVYSTEDHKFLTREGKYKKAEDLCQGDLMMGYSFESKNTISYIITEVEVIEDEESKDFYDITVDSENHNFLLSSGIVAHNCLYLKTSVQGLGVGVKSDYPNFSPVSMYNAYINNDPSLLEPNANLLIDKENSELDKLWKTGKGRVIYSYKISRSTDSMGNPGILFEGDTFIFTPNFKKFKKLVDEGKVYIDDLTDINGPKLMISKIPGARGVTIEDIENLCKECCYKSSTYNTNVTTGSTTYRIGLYDWIDFTYKNYIKLLVEVNKKKIAKTEFNISILENLPMISSYIVNNNPKATDEEISTVLGIHIDIVKEVMQKPISYLRKNKDTSSRIKNLKEELKSLKSFDPVKYTEEIIKKL